jgi:hypothetical protein
MRNQRTRLPAGAAVLLAGFALLAPFVARADGTKTVEAKGEAAILDGDNAQAKERATKAALRDAVERTLGTYIASDSQTKDFALVKDQILTTASGYVSSFDVLEEKVDGNTMVVRIKATVAAAKIESDAAARGLAIRQMKFPRMAILISEQHIGQSAPTAWWGPQGGGQAQGQGQTIAVDMRLVENQLIGDWTAAGFTFVDMDALSGKLKAARVASTNPSSEDVRQIANLSDADVIIVGTAIATKQGDLGKLLNDKSGDVSMTSCKGAINARVFNADSGEILATGEASKTALHIDPIVCDRTALQAATRIFAADMQKKLLEAWNKRIMGGSRVRMSVKGVASFRALTDLKNLLKQTIRGVQAVDQKSFKDGAADLDLRLDGGDTEALAGDLEGKPLGKFKVRVTSMTANTIAIEIAK